MDVCLTGATGYIGSAIAEALQKGRVGRPLPFHKIIFNLRHNTTLVSLL
jgi:nucleoside-diphosphate-sugar epimerase